MRRTRGLVIALGFVGGCICAPPNDPIILRSKNKGDVDAGKDARRYQDERELSGGEEGGVLEVDAWEGVEIDAWEGIHEDGSPWPSSEGGGLASEDGSRFGNAEGGGGFGGIDVWVPPGIDANLRFDGTIWPSLDGFSFNFDARIDARGPDANLRWIDTGRLDIPLMARTDAFIPPGVNEDFDAGTCRRSPWPWSRRCRPCGRLDSRLAPLPDSCLPRCQSSTRVEYSRCNGDRSCIETIANSDTHPPVWIERWDGRMAPANCRLCLQQAQTACWAMFCPREALNWDRCASRRGEASCNDEFAAFLNCVLAVQGDRSLNFRLRQCIDRESARCFAR